LDVPKLLWRGVYPDGSGVHFVLRCSRFGRPPEAWFSQLDTLDFRPSQWRFTLASWAVVVMGRLCGRPLPIPRTLDAGSPEPVVRWVREQLDTHGSCAVIATVSRCVRVALAAEKAGMSLSGVTFVVGGETPTPAKVEAMTRGGAKCVPHYNMAETGRIGLGCCNPRGTEDVHLLQDRFALLQYPQTVPGMDVPVQAFVLTTLHPGSPRIFLNAEMDDYGVVEERVCGCPLGDLGFTTHLRDIHSYKKLTGEGVTLVGSDMLDILERRLPERFGGGPLDYQLLEEEDGEGFTRLVLLVSPGIDIPDEGGIVPFLTASLRSGGSAAEQAAAIWQKAGTIRLRRQEPVLTKAGKHQPILPVRRG
jgi:hypothetical protein